MRHDCRPPARPPSVAVLGRGAPGTVVALSLGWGPQGTRGACPDGANRSPFAQGGKRPECAAKRSLPARFAHDSNICHQNVTDSVGRLRYSLPGEQVALHGVAYGARHQRYI
jgi:hypothetical protein